MSAGDRQPGAATERQARGYARRRYLSALLNSSSGLELLFVMHRAIEPLACLVVQVRRVSPQPTE